MMRITRFQKIKQHRIFRDFAWSGTGLPDFARFNLIYGWNGAGKTTLSNLFRHIQRREAVTEGEIGITLDDARTVLGSEIPTAALPSIRVFNRDTVDRSIFEEHGKELPPVYFLGEDSAKAQAEIEALKQQQTAAVAEAGSLQREHSKQAKEIELYEATQAKAIKKLLTSPGSAYNNYDAGDFRSAAGGMLKASPAAPLTSAKHNMLRKAVHGTPMLKVDRPQPVFPDVTAFNESIQALLQGSLVSNVILELQNDPEVAQWVASGLALHRGEKDSPASPTCHFCKQPIPDGRLEHLEGHFNDQYAKFQAEIALKLEEVTRARGLVKQVSFPDKGLLYVELHEPYAEQVSKFKQYAYLSDSYFLAVQRALTAKQKEPFRKLDLMQFLTSETPDEKERGALMTFINGFLLVSSNVAAVFGSAGFDRACALIDQHNEQTENFEARQKDARVALARDSVREVLDEYRAKLATCDQAKREKDAADQLCAAIRKQIAERELSSRRHHPAADELTKDMASYLGRDELRFETRNAGYAITRNGQPAMHLSEGERTAIAFMYFLKSLQDTNFDLKSGIVVIDDPVSSLDANSLYCAFGFMKSRIQDAHQVFVLTHNFTFFRQVKNWFDHIANIRDRRKADLQKLKEVRYYMLRNQANDQRRSTTLTVLDDLLFQYESEYHHMFKLVLEGSMEADDAPMSRFYALPNISRRLLEAVLAFKQPDKTGELYQQIKDIQFDEAKKARIIRFTNTYSHHGLMPEPAHDLSVLAETPEVLRDVLALVRYLDAAHFDSMSALCGTMTTEEQEA